MSAGNDITKFVREEAGSVLTFWAASLVVFMGLLALTFDFGRMAATQSELQAFADNVALAAAGELDGASDAITRATAAAETLISDTQTFGSGDKTLGGSGDYTISFYNGLPDSDTDDMATFATTDPAEAGYVRVVANDQSIALGFGAAFAALSNTDEMGNTVGAEAVAGMTRSYCDITPLMFCLPSSDFKAEDNIGKSILLRAGGNGAAWGPGAFGFIDPSSNQIDDGGPCMGLTGSNLDTCLIAAAGQRTGCFAKSGIDIATGQRVGNFEPALNVRFDIFLGSMNSNNSNPDYAPAPSVIKGYKPSGQCLKSNAAPSTDSIGMPPDDCHGDATCDRYGDGDWTDGRQNYVNINYGGSDPHPTADTRYEYYLAEIDAAGGPTSTNDIISSPTESGRPTCSAHQSPDPDRRVLVAAGVDCSAHGVGGGEKNVPVKEFYKIFMISPVGLDGTRDLWVEIVGPAGGTGGGGADAGSTFSDVVRLYR
ncbi:pilus assembly protein TadG-related protein [uncultured Litoreibacter sp.]|uniref:pilus assembly protein TadG-related protein n=1 Tax=uncultured Litoreibacter sp. TaxID=1392394 RepID=UPI002607CD98|nr:pilus assembly protein TadG-related protein [uncultured Litoreibacter sp.]